MSRLVAHFYQDLDESVTRTLNWSDDLNGSTLTTVTWALPAGLTQAATVNTPTTTSIRLTGTAPGAFTVTCTVATVAGETLQASFTLTVTG